MGYALAQGSSPFIPHQGLGRQGSIKLFLHLRPYLVRKKRQLLAIFLKLEVESLMRRLFLNKNIYA